MFLCAPVCKQSWPSKYTLLPSSAFPCLHKMHWLYHPIACCVGSGVQGKDGGLGAVQLAYSSGARQLACSSSSASPCFYKLLFGPAQVREVRGQEVVCMAQNDAMLGGLLTVIHSELNESGMSSLQARRRAAAALLQHGCRIMLQVIP